MNLENHGEMFIEPSARMDSKLWQTHNMMQVWMGKLSELQLPVQNPAREVACTSMQHIQSDRIT